MPQCSQNVSMVVAALNSAGWHKNLITPKDLGCLCPSHGRQETQLRLGLFIGWLTARRQYTGAKNRPKQKENSKSPDFLFSTFWKFNLWRFAWWRQWFFTKLQNSDRHERHRSCWSDLYCWRSKVQILSGTTCHTRANLERYDTIMYIHIYVLYDIIWYYMISYYIILYHIISYYIILYQIISYHIISYHIISYHYHILSYYIILHHITSYHIISYHITSSYHIILDYMTILHHIMSVEITFHSSPPFSGSSEAHTPALWWVPIDRSLTTSQVASHLQGVICVINKPGSFYLCMSFIPSIWSNYNISPTQISLK